MASIFLPKLALELLKNGDTENDNNCRSVSPQKEFKTALELSLTATLAENRQESERIRDPEFWKPLSTSENEVLQKGTSEEKDHRSSWHFHRFVERGWEEIRKEWGMAMTHNGIIDRENSDFMPAHKETKRFDLWRGMIDIDGYVCCVAEKQDIISRLIRDINAFRLSGRKSAHICGMLIGSPGVGKTHLVRQLAASLDLEFLSFNITQMVARTDILDCFDTIVTTQAKDRSKTILVFVDEINAKLDGDLVYNAFLVPIEDGKYIRGGKLFHIEPCIWIFSGTSDPSTDDDKDRSSKGSDFVSRLTLGLISLDDIGDQMDRKSVERVYQGISLLCKTFPDVRQISEKVIDLFRHLPECVKIRDLKRLISAFNDIQFGKVYSKNVPRHLLDPKINNYCIDSLREFPYADWIGHEEHGNTVPIIIEEPDIYSQV